MQSGRLFEEKHTVAILYWPDKDGCKGPTFVGRHCPDYEEYFDCLFAAEDKWQELESAFETIVAIANKWMQITDSTANNEGDNWAGHGHYIMTMIMMNAGACMLLDFKYGALQMIDGEGHWDEDRDAVLKNFRRVIRDYPGWGNGTNTTAAGYRTSTIEDIMQAKYDATLDPLSRQSIAARNFTKEISLPRFAPSPLVSSKGLYIGDLTKPAPDATEEDDHDRRCALRVMRNLPPPRRAETRGAFT